MDHLEQSIAKASAEAAEDAARDAEKAAKAEELAAALDKAQGQMSAQELSEAMSILAQDVQRAAEDDALLADELSEELKEDCEKRFAHRGTARRIGADAGKVQRLRSGEAPKTGRGQADRSLAAGGDARGSAKSIPTLWRTCFANATARRTWKLCLAECNQARPGRSDSRAGRRGNDLDRRRQPRRRGLSRKRSCRPGRLPR